MVSIKGQRWQPVNNELYTIPEKLFGHAEKFQKQQLFQTESVKRELQDMTKMEPKWKDQNEK